ncbi:Rrf2 family transcriptional regulator [Halorientalis persicus]|nr:Rrf2 family transcriptional regulator [Halorientalis persicus]
MTISDVRDRLDELIHGGFEQNGTTLVEALPTIGKSQHIVEWAETTGEDLTIFTARHELYGQYEEWCRERGLDYRILPAFQHECETMGENEPIEVEVNEVYESGITGAELHRNAERYFGEQLPCQRDGRCSYMEKRDFVPENYDVLIGHYLQAHNDDYLEDRYVAFDEFPGDAYFFEPRHNEATRAITNYLEAEQDLPFDTWKRLYYHRGDSEYEDEVEAWKSDLGFYSHKDTRYILQRKPGFHANAPLLTHAALEFDLLDNDWEYATLGSGRRAVRSSEDEWTILNPPPIHRAKSVVALDGTPTVTKWRLILGGDWINHEEVLDTPEEKRHYLEEILGLTIIQTTADSKPYHSGDYVNVDSDGALLESIHEKEGTRSAVITSKAAEELYSASGVDNHIGISEHYNNLIGSNQFKGVQLGSVIGSPHPPEDEAVQRWAALDGESVERQEYEDGTTKRGTYLDFGPFGNALFQDVVHNEILQAVMRFGRTPGKDEPGATVYVHTFWLPDWVIPEKQLQVKTWSDGMNEVVTALQESEKWPSGEWTNKEIAESISIGVRQVSKLMQELDEEGYVAHRRGGRGNAYHWSNIRLDDFSEFGKVEDVSELSRT